MKSYKGKNVEGIILRYIDRAHGTIIDPKGKKCLVTFRGDFPGLEELQKAIGGYIDICYLPDGNVLIFDEDGKSKGRPYNTHTSLMTEVEIYGRAILINKDYLR